MTVTTRELKWEDINILPKNIFDYFLFFKKAFI